MRAAGTAAPAGSPSVWDEAFADDGRVRGLYAASLEALRAAGPAAVAVEMASRAAASGLSLGTGSARRRLPVDPVPRVFGTREWAALAAGLVQRARMLEALLADLTGPRASIAAGALPEEVVASSHYREPDLLAAGASGGRLGIIGFDVIRGPDGGLRVLEDNLLTPGHAAVSGLRGLSPLEPGSEVLDVHAEACRLLREMLGTARGRRAIILSDVSHHRASWELRRLAQMTGVPVCGYADVTCRGSELLTRGDGRRVEVVWQRTSEDRLRDPSGKPTALGELLLAPLLAGTVDVVNAIGCGVADDKRTFAHTPALFGPLLGEPPRVPVVQTFDLGDPAVGGAALAAAATHVFKPRWGAGGRGVSVPPHASRTLAAIAAEPSSWVAQPWVPLSVHPTVAGDRLVPRAVDLRVFAVRGDGGWEVPPGGVSRYPTAAGQRLVNTSLGGGVKDVWVLEP